MPTIYLLHIEPPYKGMKHYIGGTEKQPMARFAEHVAGTGARLTRLAIQSGCVLALVRTWPNQPWEFERKLKGRSAKPLCPICSGAEWREGGVGLPAVGG
jgi:predicted GIY-YIG superfamily endonuclease